MSLYPSEFEFELLIVATSLGIINVYSWLSGQRTVVNDQGEPMRS